MNNQKQQNESKPIKRNNNWLVYSLIAGLVLFIAGIVAFLLISKPVMSPYLYLMLGIAGVIVVVGIIFAIVAVKKGERREPDYFTFFILGLTWIPLGFALDNSGFWVMGLVFMIIGIANKDKWKEREKWSEMSDAKKRLKLSLIIILGLGVLAGIAAYYLVAK